MTVTAVIERYRLRAYPPSRFPWYYGYRVRFSDGRLVRDYGRFPIAAIRRDLKKLDVAYSENWKRL